jgi:hypothetical protein
MTLTINAKAFTADSFQKDSVGYTGPAHTLSLKDYVRLLRAPAKPTATLSGVSRTDAKLTRTLTLTGALTPTHDAILDINTSIPVGAASADIDAILNDMGAYLASAAYKTFVKSQLINY